MSAGRILSGVILVLLWVVPASPWASAQHVSFAERFALAHDREAVLKELVPGTEDYQYYHVLHYQNTGRLEEAAKLLDSWPDPKDSPRATELRHRLKLLQYATDPGLAVEYLTRQLDLRFDHQPERQAQDSGLPSTLDPAAIDRVRLAEAILARPEYQNTVEPFEPSAYEWLIGMPLDPARRHDLLQRLSRPDYPDLPKWIVDDLNSSFTGSFGSMPIHNALTPAQLEELLRLKPGLLNETPSMSAYVLKLAPRDGVVIDRDPEEREAFLDRLASFAARLDPQHNSFKAHVLYHRLVHDRSRGVYDRNRFLAYLRLPRYGSYVRGDFIARPEFRNVVANLGTDYQNLTGLPTVHDDEALVRSYLEHFLAREDSYAAFEDYIDRDYLRRVFAATKLLYGGGNPEAWTAVLSPDEYAALRDRVDIDFDPANPAEFAADAPVALDVWVKNVPTLIVRVFEINASNYYRRMGREVETGIDLDGLEANDERVFRYDTPPVRREKRHIEFPSLDKRGVYIVDLIGNGMSSRALIRKGEIRHTVRTGAAGLVFTLHDETGSKVKDGRVWIAGREYRPGADGSVTVPFTATPGEVTAILSDGDLSVLRRIFHPAEEYRLEAGFHVDRESLVAGETAKVLVRPLLTVQGAPVALSLLESPTLVLVSVDGNDVTTRKEVPDFPVTADRESVHEFRVPSGLRSISFTLQGRVQKLSTGEDQELNVSSDFAVNRIDAGPNTEALHLGRAPEGYTLDLLGKTGEAKSLRPVQLALKHRDFKEPIRQTLQTDSEGRVRLGALEGIVQLKATGPEGVEQTWDLQVDQAAYPTLITAVAGDTIRLPYLGAGSVPDRAEFTLLERRQGRVVEDRFDAIALEGGFIAIRGLRPGEYELLVKPRDARVAITVAEGVRSEGFILTDRASMRSSDLARLQVTGVTAGSDHVEVRLAHATPETRVHVVATVFVPTRTIFADLGTPLLPPPDRQAFARRGAIYTSGRSIGDEYRYVLDRKYAGKFAGVMVDRPGLLLNPWSLTPTETETQEAAPGAPPPPSPLMMAEAPVQDSPARLAIPPIGGEYPNLDFLPGDGVVLANLAPDADGVVRIPRADLRGRRQLHVLAVDSRGAVYRQFPIDAANPPFDDLRLAESLDPEVHAVEQKRVTALRAGEEWITADAGAVFELYDTVAKVFGLYATLRRDGNNNLDDFAFLARWHRMEDAEKRKHYSERASHELNFFLYKKDPAFFEAVVRPFLANKAHKQFMDRWLLDQDLAEYLQPWRYERLNTVERILLAQRVGEERDRIRDHIRDQAALLRPDPDRFEFLFRTALQASAFQDTREPLQAMYFAMPGGVGGGAGGFGGGGLGGGGVSLEEMAAMRGRLEQMKALPGAPAAGAVSVSPEALREGVSEQWAAGFPGQPMPGPAAGRDINGDGSVADYLYLETQVDMEEDLARRAVARPMYRGPDKTEEWAESDYYRVPLEGEGPGLVPVSAFWRDYADFLLRDGTDAGETFLSAEFLDAARTRTEALFALAVLDLPMEAPDHQGHRDDDRSTLTAAGPILLVHKETAVLEASGDDAPVLVSERFFDPQDPYRFEGGERLDKFVSGEFLVQTVYGGRVVVSNPTSSPRRLEVLMQVPQGSVPVRNSEYTRTVTTRLDPYSTAALEYFFYFPAPGTFAHYPVQVAENEGVLASGEPQAFAAVPALTAPDTTAWRYVAQQADTSRVLEYLEQENLGRVDLAQLAWRMSDREFYAAAIDRLSKRRVYDHVLWSYAFLHRDEAGMREFLNHAGEFIAQVGPYLDSPLLRVEPVARRTYQHLEYAPLVNARVHTLGAQRSILNERFAGQYSRFIDILAHRAEFRPDDLMETVYYLLLQDRIEEALDFFGRVDRAQLDAQLQYDYFAAYLAMARGEPAAARAAAAPYAEYPVDRWRALFAAVLEQLDEIESAASASAADPGAPTRQDRLAAGEPTVELAIEAGEGAAAPRVTVSYRNVEELQVRYYPMDVEMLFSKDPFGRQQSDQFAMVRPSHAETVRLDADRTAHVFDLPERYRGGNVVVEVEGGGVRKSQAHYANALSVHVIEPYGQVQVTRQGAGTPLAKVYVKVFARMNDGSVRFYKDGYTDLRGRFDYAALSTDDLDRVERFAILLVSEADGAVVREAAPPSR